MTLALAAVQVRVDVADLDGPDAFRRRMLEHGERAASATTGARHRLFVFPENLGHAALLALAPARVRRARTVEAAVALYAASRPLSVARAALTHRRVSMTQTALLALCPAAQALMHATFGTLARQRSATVVAGSMLRARGRRVVNSSATYDSSGALAAVTDKVNLVRDIEDESRTGLGLARGDPDRLPVVRAPWGSLATLICYDGFRQSYTGRERFALMGARADNAGVDVVANPAANPWRWDAPWQFGGPGKSMSRQEQWRAEGLPAMLSELRHTRYGVTAHLAGTVLDQSFEGRSEILGRTGKDVAVLAEAAAIDQSEVVVAQVPIPR